MLKDMAKEGIKKVIALTPGFPTDNLESLYDIDIEARNIFLKNGGKEFIFVPGLNAEDYWVEAIIRIIASKT
jgi:ferrochelatase